MKLVRNTYERVARCEMDLLPSQFRYQASGQTIQSAKMPLREQSPHSLQRFLYRMVKDREPTFAETAESLRMNLEVTRISSEDCFVGITASGDLLRFPDRSCSISHRACRDGERL